ncbi:MAG: 4a-hydroxytetrahydrobiopterin dehydratase [Alphaproteobacteria bacterium]|nr:4a-hydroxytetrahydrobiopterin dehydratase [Alphaproteobacteria bacterium]
MQREPEALDRKEIERRLEGVKGWHVKDDVLCGGFRFVDFSQAFAFLTRVALAAERVQHHPDMELYGYRKVAIRLVTHDAGDAITQKDIDLALEISEFASNAAC